ncbi:hypothetical protein FIU87_01365 [Bacillus sp. THAF10]|uniref:DUF58 domain-containing protein n=1 Tax=Bacillus sp. THAF10 TaxID=2587848 RepID=UPI0012679541|nr:DUF58 domain-containing protein [Bacillus sp. THAF10]QFT87301.1 hypothetical protein FIU87_01365 [Bacillus sp. THAF10]
MDPNMRDYYYDSMVRRVKERLGDRSTGLYENGEWKGWHQKINITKQHKMASAVLFMLLSSALYVGSTLMIFLLFSIFAYMWANYLYLMFVGRDLEMKVVEEKIKLFDEEQGVLRLQISHRSHLPIFFGKLRVGTDKNLLFHGGEKLLHINQMYMPFQQIGRSVWEVELPFTATKRGVAQLQLFDLEIESFFGWGKVYQQTRGRLKFEVIVYPKSQTVQGLERILPKKQGEHPVRTSLFEEKSRVIGTRDYVNGDSFGQIHWKATARMNTLQSKVYERTSQLSWLFIIDIHTSNFEEKLRGAAFLLHYATKHNIAYSVLVNIKKFGNPSYVELNVGEGKQQLHSALLLLARMKQESVMIPPSMFAKVVHQHATAFPYAIVCADEGVYERWKLPGTMEGFALNVIDETTGSSNLVKLGASNLLKLPDKEKQRIVG